MSGREIIFEFQTIGRSVKVTALDVATDTEISITGDAGAPEAYLKQVALKKLEYVLSKEKKPEPSAG
ncbi:MAG: hypothetical protein AB7G80_04040 [Dongiaceae bacterium]